MKLAIEVNFARRCPVCGHPAGEVRCGRCGGEARSLAVGSAPLRVGRGFFVADFVDGLTTFFRAGLRLLHHRAFVGKLRLPVWSNALVFALLVLAAVFGLAPLGTAMFEGPWPMLDGLRASVAGRAPLLLACAVLGMCGPTLLEVPTGPSTEGLVETAEMTIAGPGMRVLHEQAWAPMVARMRASARVLGAQLVLSPVVFALALLPWVGPALLLVCCGASAAVVFFEAPYARRGLLLRARLAGLWHNRYRALGFGVAFQLGAAVPFLNLLALAPTACVAAAWLYFRFDKRGDGD